MKYQHVAVMSVFFLLLTSGCAISNANAKTSSDVVIMSAGNTELSAEQLDELLGMDFSVAIRQCEYISPFDEDGEKYSSWMPFSILQDELSEGEARLLGMTFTPPDGRRNIIETIAFASGFFGAQGRFPVNGAELFPWVLTLEGLNKLRSMDPGQQYHQLYAAVNPVTGSFFSGFDNPDWHPGGIYLEPVTDEEFITERYSNAVETPGKLPSVLRVVVFGEKPDTVLIDKYVATRCKQRSFEWPRSINNTVTSK
jgi:hypothetical protein